MILTKETRKNQYARLKETSACLSSYSSIHRRLRRIRLAAKARHWLTKRTRFYSKLKTISFSQPSLGTQYSTIRDKYAYVEFYILCFTVDKNIDFLNAT